MRGHRKPCVEAVFDLHGPAPVGPAPVGPAPVGGVGWAGLSAGSLTDCGPDRAAREVFDRGAWWSTKGRAVFLIKV